MPLGIPHSVFLGRVVAVGEPTWLADDMDKALAYQRDKLSRCQRCGHRPDEWVDDDGTMLYPPPHEAVLESCPGCAEIDRLRRSMTGGRDGELDGVTITLAPFDPQRPPPIPYQQPPITDGPNTGS